MVKFRIHSIESAPVASRELLQKAKAKSRVVFNPFGVMAESPATVAWTLAS